MTTNNKQIKKLGRPSKYSEKIADKICELYASGKTITECARLVGIERHAVYRWMKVNKDFSYRLACARELFADAIAEEALRIADTPMTGEIVEETASPDGMIVKVKKVDMIEHRKLQVDTRLKLLAKWAPDKYGDIKTLKVDATDEAKGMAEVYAKMLDAQKDDGEESV